MRNRKKLFLQVMRVKVKQYTQEVKTLKTVTKINESTLISSDEEGALKEQMPHLNNQTGKHKGFIPHPEKLIEEKKAETIEISSEDETNNNKKCSRGETTSGKIHPLNLTKERQTELINAKTLYEQELVKEKATLESPKATTKVVELNNLPIKEFNKVEVFH